MCDFPKCFTKYEPTARKNHICCECGGRIEKGDKYHVLSGIWPDGPLRFKTCLDCVALREEFESANNFRYDEKPMLEGLIDEVSEVPEFWPKLRMLFQKKGRRIPEWMKENTRV